MSKSEEKKSKKGEYEKPVKIKGTFLDVFKVVKKDKEKGDTERSKGS